MTSHTPESLLLRPVDPRTDSDDWPILTLSSCEVFQGASSRSHVSLLTADVHTPLILRGKLPSVPRDLAHLRLQPGVGAELIELREVRQFAYGQYDDGRIELWAAGKAGWFTVRPARGYKAIYEGMIEAIEALYYLADTYGDASGQTKIGRKGKRRRGEISAEECFAGFAQRNGLRNEEMGMQVFERARTFLIKSMLAGKEGIDWERTGVWEWLSDNYADDIEQARSAPARAKAQSKKSSKRKRDRRVSQHDPAKTRSIRGSHSRQRDSEAAPATPRRENSVSESEMERRSGKRLKSGKGKSVLRPKPTRPVLLESEGSQDGTGSPRQDPIPKLRLLSGSKRVNNLEPEAHDAIGGAEAIDEGIDMGHDDSDESTMEDSNIIVSQPKSSQAKITIRLRKPDVTPYGAGDTWSCPLDGCLHKVYAASDPSSQKMIKEHYRLHVNDEDAERRIELVRRMEAPGQPVSRLVKKIQDIGMRGFPPPVIRRF